MSEFGRERSQWQETDESLPPLEWALAQHTRALITEMLDSSLENNSAQLCLLTLPDDQQDLYARLASAITQDGHKVFEFDETSLSGWIAIRLGINGQAHEDGSISLRTMDSRNKIFTLLHEYAHQILQHPVTPAKSALQEYHAESISYVVSAYLGLHNPYSVGYLTDAGATPSRLEGEAQAIIETAGGIIRRLAV